jgi:glycosyltransferase involved in cell wall biosynthesis
MKKHRLLAWLDSPTAGTGFGTVAKNVLTALHNTGLYEIDQLAINYHGDFVNKNEVPWQLSPAKILDPKDPHGIKMFQRCLQQNLYDIVWVCNDLFVTHEVREFIPQVRAAYKNKNLKPPVFIYYYPVDCEVNAWATGLLDQCDIPVCYTTHGKFETVKTRPELIKKLRQIPHGVDTKLFYPLSKTENDNTKKQLLNVGPDTTVVVQVNRNSTRKQIPYSFLAFKEFKKKVPNSIMYVHSQPLDQGGDLKRAVESAGLSLKTDVVLPVNFNLANPLNTKQVNSIYNMGDIFLTTHLGEGWGLTVTEAMACNVPVVAPRNTCMPEQLGENSERGYLYECKDSTYIDASGFRAKGLIPDIVDQMMLAYKDGKNSDNLKAKKAFEYAKSLDWSLVGKNWVSLFNEALTVRANTKTSFVERV